VVLLREPIRRSEVGQVRSDHLACAHCGGIVADGGCSVCRITREQLDRQRFTVPAPIVGLMVALMTLLIVFAARHAV
jgi:hypothetical protein